MPHGKSKGCNNRLSGRPPRSSLLHKILISKCLLYLTAALAASCKSEKVPVSEWPLPGNSSRIVMESPLDINCLDIFIYRDSGIKALLLHRRTDTLAGAGQLEMDCAVDECDCIAVVLASSPGHPSVASLQSFDAMERLQMSYAREHSDYPFMSGMAQFHSPGSAVIKLTPLLCKVSIKSIDNCIEGQPLLRNPRIYLRNINASAQVLRQDGFRPSETISPPGNLRSPELMFSQLGKEIGYHRQETDLNLYCYPNDSPYGGPGTPRTEIVFEADTQDGPYIHIEELPAIRRAEDTVLDIKLY